MKNAVAKSLGTILIFAYCAALTTAQTTCDLASKSAALFLGLRLGASPVEARSVTGNSLKIKIKKRGERTFFQNFIKKPAPFPLNGVRALYLRFYDLKLYQIEIFYEPRADLQTLDEIKNRLAGQFDLSAADWRTENNRAVINCGAQSLAADNVLNPRIELTDEIARRQIENSRRDKK